MSGKSGQGSSKKKSSNKSKSTLKNVLDDFDSSSLLKFIEITPIKEAIQACRKNIAEFPKHREKVDQAIADLPWHQFMESHPNHLHHFVLSIDESLNNFIEYCDNYLRIYYLNRLNTFWDDYPQSVEHICRFSKFFLEFMNYADRMRFADFLYLYMEYCISRKQPIRIDVLQIYMKLESSLILNYFDPMSHLFSDRSTLPPRVNENKTYARQLYLFLNFYTQNPQLFIKPVEEALESEKILYRENLKNYILPCYSLIKKISRANKNLDVLIARFILKFICETNPLPDITYLSEAMIFLANQPGAIDDQSIFYWNNLLKNWARQAPPGKSIDSKFFNLILSTASRFMPVTQVSNRSTLEVWMDLLSFPTLYQTQLSEGEQIKLFKLVDTFFVLLQSVESADLFDENAEILQKSFMACVKLCYRLDPLLDYSKVTQTENFVYGDWIKHFWDFFEDQHGFVTQTNSHEIWLDIMIKLIKSHQPCSIDILKNLLDSISAENQLSYLQQLLLIANPAQCHFMLLHYSKVFEKKHDLLGLFLQTMHEKYPDFDLGTCLDSKSSIHEALHHYQSMMNRIDAYLTELEEDRLLSNSRLYLCMKDYLLNLKLHSHVSTTDKLLRLDVVIPAYESIKVLKIEAQSCGMLFKDAIQTFSQMLNDSTHADFEIFISELEQNIMQFKQDHPKALMLIQSGDIKDELNTATFERLLQINHALVVKEIEDYYVKIKILRKLGLFDECIVWCKKFQMLFKERANDKYILSILASAYSVIQRPDLAYRQYRKLQVLVTDPRRRIALKLNIANCCVKWGTSERIAEAKQIYQDFIDNLESDVLNENQRSEIIYMVAKGILFEGNSPVFFEFLKKYLGERHQLLINLEVAISRSNYSNVIDLAYQYLVEQHDIIVLRKFLYAVKDSRPIDCEKMGFIESIYHQRYQESKNLSMLMSLISIQIKWKRFDDVLDNLQELEQTFGKSMWSLHKLCVVYYKSGRYEQVIGLLSQMANIQSYKYLYFSLALNYGAIPEHAQKGMACFDYLISTYPSNKLFYDKALELATKYNDIERLMKYHAEYTGTQYEDEEKYLEELEASALNENQDNFCEEIEQGPPGLMSHR